MIYQSLSDNLHITVGIIEAEEHKITISSYLVSTVYRHTAITYMHFRTSWLSARR